MTDNNNISLNDMLKNAAERAKNKAGLTNEPKKEYSNWGNYPKNDSKPFDFNKATDNLSRKLNDLSSTVSVKFAQSVSELNDKINKQEKEEKTTQNSEDDLASAYPDLLDEWKVDEEKSAKENKGFFDRDSFLSSNTVDDITDRLRNASQKVRESETFGRVSRTLNDYRMSISDALDDGDKKMAETVDHTDGSELLVDAMRLHSPVVVSGKEKGRVVQELSDAARKTNMSVEQIPMVLKDEVSLRRLVSEVRAVKDSDRVVVLDIADSPNAEQLKIFVKFLEDAKAGNFHLVVLSDDEFSNSWFVINGAVQKIYDF